MSNSIFIVDLCTGVACIVIRTYFITLELQIDYQPNQATQNGYGDKKDIFPVNCTRILRLVIIWRQL